MTAFTSTSGAEAPALTPMRRTPDSISAAAAQDVRQRFWIEGEIAADAHVRFDITEIFGAESNAKVLAILGQVPNEPLAVAAHRRSSVGPSARATRS